ncbi:hypothetical protein TNCV_901881 [Trichonephila clavipes]|nr:hypothetical protein TNCV_901881 [Trichonephila clavipes]
MTWMMTIEYTARTSLVQINGNFNADQYVSHILGPVLVPYCRGLWNVLYQHDNARPHSTRPVLIFLDTKDIRLFL